MFKIVLSVLCFFLKSNKRIVNFNVFRFILRFKAISQSSVVKVHSPAETERNKSFYFRVQIAP